MKDRHSRRKFLRKYLFGGTALLGGGLVFNSCNTKSPGDREEQSVADVSNCGDLTNVSENEISKRKSFGYVEETPITENYCGNCSLYLPPEGGKKCGECILFKGPVYEKGYCTYWAPVTQG